MMGNMVQLQEYKPHKIARATFAASPSMTREMEILMQPHITPTALTLKTCSKCKESKPATAEYFRAAKRYTNGLYCWCRACETEYHRANKRPYTDKRAEYNRAYFRTYSVANKEIKAEYDRSYRARNKAKINQRLAKWHVSNPLKAKEYRSRLTPNRDGRRAIKYRYLARKRNAEGSHSTADIKRQYKAQKGKCYYCKTIVGNTYHVDHAIPLSRGGSNGPENIVIACPSCNTSKRDKLPSEWVKGGRLL